MMADTFTPKILLFRGKGVVDRLIQFRTWSVYSHAALLIGTDRVLESYPGDGVRTRTLTVEDWSCIDLFSVPEMTPEGWQKAVNFGMSQLGCGYDWAGIFRFVSRGRARLDGKWWCSEIVVGMCSRGGVPLFRFDDPGGLPPEKSSPGDIATSIRVRYEAPPLVSVRPTPAQCSHPVLSKR